MRSVIIIHDSYSGSSEPWIVSVGDELKVRGMNVYAPKFPTPIGQDYISWKVLFDSYAQYIDSETILVGSGVGCAFILRYVSENPVTVAKTVFVAPFVSPVTNPSEQLLAQSFLLPAFDTTLLKPRLGRVEVVVSDNDLLVEPEMSKRVADMFGARILTLSGKGHFRAINGVRLLPELVELIAEPVAPVVQTTPVVPATPVPMPSVSAVQPQAPAQPTMVSIAGQVSPTATTDVVALQKLLAELSAKGMNIPAASPTTPLVAPIPTPTVGETGSLPATTPAMASPATLPPLHPNVEVVGQVEQVVFEEATAKPTAVAHSLVSDFSSSLINANAGEVSKTLNDYRSGKEYSAREKTMRVFRVIAMLIGLLLLTGAGYLGYRVYFFNENLPTIKDLNLPPLEAVSAQPVKFERNLTPVQSIDRISDALAGLDIANTNDIGVLELITEEGDRMTADNAIKMIGGNTPSSIYTKVDNFYAIGAVKSLVGSSPFAVFSLNKPEKEVLAELSTWEEWMQNDLVALFAPGGVISAETHTFKFEDRTIANRDTRVLVATRKQAPVPEVEKPILELSKPVIQPNGIPDTSTPVLPLETSISLDADDIAQSATVVTDDDLDAEASVSPDSASATGSKQERNIIDLFKISATEQTAIKRTRDSLIIASNSPIFQRGILPGDLFSLESSDKDTIEEAKELPAVDAPVDGAVNPDEDTKIAPILGGAPTIVQITDIIQNGNKTELAYKTLPLSEAISLVGQEVLSNTLPNGASVLAPEVVVLDTGPVDVFAYSVVNGKVLVFSSDVDNIPFLADKYFTQKKSIFDMFR